MQSSYLSPCSSYKLRRLLKPITFTVPVVVFGLPHPVLYTTHRNLEHRTRLCIGYKNQGDFLLMFKQNRLSGINKYFSIHPLKSSFITRRPV